MRNEERSCSQYRANVLEPRPVNIKLETIYNLLSVVSARRIELPKMNH
jgi:hypothetical protein